MMTPKVDLRTAASAAELRAAELALGDAAERPLDLDFGQRLDAVIAEMLIEHTAERPVADPVQVIETLVRIAAGVAIVTGRDMLWFQDYARGIYRDERVAREARKSSG